MMTLLWPNGAHEPLVPTNTVSDLYGTAVALISDANAAASSPNLTTPRLFIMAYEVGNEANPMIRKHLVQYCYDYSCVIDQGRDVVEYHRANC